MKKQPDKIEKVLAGYHKAAAKRAAVIQKKEAEEKAEINARKQFEVGVRKKITSEVRPAMQKLFTRLDKKLFSCSIENSKTANYPDESYEVKALKEENVNFYLHLIADEEKNVVRFTCAYSVDEGDNEYDMKYMHVEEINEKLMEDSFLFCLQKICK